MAKSNRRNTTPSQYHQIIDEIGRGEHDAQHDMRRRRILLENLEKGDPQPRRVAMYYSRLDRELSHHDVLPFRSMLKVIGKVENLDLIMHSPGGDGLVAEKLLDMCRTHCTGKLRMVIPLYAKSAATLMALGCDEIIMGETSEIGPIDAQVFLIQDGQPQQVSADHFIRAEKAATEKLASTDPEVQEAGHIQLAGLAPAFLVHCQDLQNLGKELARRQLQSHMFASECATDEAMWKGRIGTIVNNLTSSGTHLAHGKMITAADIRSDADLKYLKLIVLPENDQYWMLLDELLQRTDVVAKTQNLGKILLAKGFQMIGH